MQHSTLFYCLALSSAFASVALASGLASRWRRARAPWVAVGGWVLEVLPPGVRATQDLALLRADLDARIGVDAWVGFRCIVSAACLLVGLLLAAAGFSAAAWGALPVLLAVNGVSGILLRRRRADRERRILKELPAYLDALTVCVEAGATLNMALRIVVEKADPSPLRRIFTAMLQEIRMGRARVDAFNHVARLHDIDALGALVAALVQSEGHGMSLGAVLRAQSHQRATERQLRAEKAALKAPVKMLGPLVLCIFPCTFIVIAVPVVVRIFMEVR
ncbi:MAG: hypothetical protein RLZZ393_1436 [Pseudomonadota bacterium]|jgi:tight adherence protein C